MRFVLLVLVQTYQVSCLGLFQQLSRPVCSPFVQELNKNPSRKEVLKRVEVLWQEKTRAGIPLSISTISPLALFIQSLNAQAFAPQLQALPRTFTKRTFKDVFSRIFPKGRCKSCAVDVNVAKEESKYLISGSTWIGDCHHGGESYIQYWTQSCESAASRLESDMDKLGNLLRNLWDQKAKEMKVTKAVFVSDFLKLYSNFRDRIGKCARFTHVFEFREGMAKLHDMAQLTGPFAKPSDYQHMDPTRMKKQWSILNKGELPAAEQEKQGGKKAADTQMRILANKEFFQQKSIVIHEFSSYDKEVADLRVSLKKKYQAGSRNEL